MNDRWLKSRHHSVSKNIAEIPCDNKHSDGDVSDFHFLDEPAAGPDLGNLVLIGGSLQTRELQRLTIDLANVDLSVLILGESGTGKELVAERIHKLGLRSCGPFVAVNCAGLAESLIESELFGHERGAFTDAREMRRGRFEVADGGTLFLDEIGDMSLAGQAKLLRTLETRTVVRVGGTKPIPVDVRILAATNQRLHEAVQQGRFRLDLYYRLSAVTVEIAPLRARVEDIIPLAEFFLTKAAKRAGRSGLQLTSAAEFRLLNHPWPGNVRELRSVIERAAFLSPSHRIGEHDLAFARVPATKIVKPFSDDSCTKNSLRLFVERLIAHQAANSQPMDLGTLEREHILGMLDWTCGNKSEAAQCLGIERTTLDRKLKRYECERKRSQL